MAVLFDQADSLVRVLQLQLHVALSPGEKDLADAQIRRLQAFPSVGHAQSASRSGLLRRQKNQEFPAGGLPFSLGQQRTSAVPQLAAHPGAVLRLSENPQLLPAAQHRAVCKQGG